MNTRSIRNKLRVCNRCDYLCDKCPHALQCVRLGQQVRPTECYICWHNEGTVLPRDCHVRGRNAGTTTTIGRRAGTERSWDQSS